MDIYDNESLTEAATEFATNFKYENISDNALWLSRRCILDGIAVMIGGTEQETLNVLDRYIKRIGGTPESRVIGNNNLKIPAHLAALWNGLAGHAMDWDDTQLSVGPGRMYGLLTHPTVPPLSACLSLAETLTNVSGEKFITSFNAGFEVECKIAEAINPDHYARGFHTSGTIGTFGSAVAAAKILDFDHKQIAMTIGIASSMASGIRANFGTMTKPLHVGRSSENGVIAAMLVKDGFTADQTALDGKWGYISIAGPGGNPELVVNKFGRPLTLESPGISIKPYPCGVLTHPSMDALGFLMKEQGINSKDIKEIKLFAAKNILGPIRYKHANTELEGKFCMNFLLAAIAIAGKAGKSEFTDDFVRRKDVQDMQVKVTTINDIEIENMGFDRIRSRVEVITNDNKSFTKWADENYRGSPHNPLSDKEIEMKFRDASEGLLTENQIRNTMEKIWNIEKLEDTKVILDDLSWRK